METSLNILVAFLSVVQKEPGVGFALLFALIALIALLILYRAMRVLEKYLEKRR